MTYPIAEASGVSCTNTTGTYFPIDCPRYATIRNVPSRWWIIRDIFCYWSVSSEATKYGH